MKPQLHKQRITATETPALESKVEKLLVGLYQFYSCEKNIFNKLNTHLFISFLLQRRLDILKIDTEGAKWRSLAEMVRNGSIQDVKQLIVEFHIHTYFNNLTSRKAYISHLTLFRNLYKLGFRIFYFRMWNPLPSLVFKDGGVFRTGCHEVHFMRPSK